MTFTLPDPAGTIYTLLSTYWVAANINGTVTPTFGRKEQQGRSRVKNQVLVYPRISDAQDIGRGSHVDWTNHITVEVRCGDASNDTVFSQLVQEVIRIINTYRNSAGGSYDYIRVSPGGIRDESYQGLNWYRTLIDVEMMMYNVSKT